ncbi:MAG: response regulator [Pseudomonadota bacterium]
MSAQDAIARILIAEDNQVNRLVIENMIDTEKYDLIFAENGKEACKLFETADIDLVLMDISMPVMDGEEALKTIRSIEAKRVTAPTPIIALTAHALEDDFERFRRAGFDDCIAKPVRKATIDACLSNWIDGNSIGTKDPAEKAVG